MDKSPQSNPPSAATEPPAVKMPETSPDSIVVGKKPHSVNGANGVTKHNQSDSRSETLVSRRKSSIEGVTWQKSDRHRIRISRHNLGSPYYYD